MQVDFLIYNCFGKKIAEKSNFYFETKELAECFAEGLIIGISHGKKKNVRPRLLSCWQS